MNSQELRKKYLDFFAERGHAIISSASLIPENDPTALFISAGMHPLVPYLLGEKHPAGVRLCSVQKCIRTDDIEEVGDFVHHTFFEMLGNWSLGDYFKKESIAYSWEFLTDPKYLGLDKNRLAVSVFKGDSDAPFDSEAYDLWKDIFIANNLPLERIARLPKKNNWWGPASATGPCGPDSEIFYWSDSNLSAPSSFNDDNNLWVEVWNNVFMQYNKNAAGEYEPLSQKNVDTGLGLERTLAVLNGSKDNYQTDLFAGIILKIETLSGHLYNENEETRRSFRIIADHLKAAVFIIGDPHGVVPSNNDQGYIVRRLIRRAIRHGLKLGIFQEAWTAEIARQAIEIYRDVHQELEDNKDFIIENLLKEEEKFSKTLERGVQEFNKLSGNDISGPAAFKLYQSYGFPLEITEDLAREKNIKVDRIGFELELKKHQESSRTASAGKFKGGLADGGEETVKLHTAAHLLLESLRRVLGTHVFQKGSNITPERLRFDFSHPEKMTALEIKEVEDLVNDVINKNFSVACEELSLEEARQRGAMGVFDSKYDERVKVFTVSNLNPDGTPNLKAAYSQEICGGPHVKNTGILGKFKIIKEESSSAGIRRIKAVLEK